MMYCYLYILKPVTFSHCSYVSNFKIMNLNNMLSSRDEIREPSVNCTDCAL
jgi:hypothetical protein